MEATVTLENVYRVLIALSAILRKPFTRRALHGNPITDNAKLACAAACTPLFIINPVAYAACLTGCVATAQEGGDIGNPTLREDGTIVFEK